MSQLPNLLDLSIAFTRSPAGSPPEVLATITLRCDQLGLSHTGDLLTDPLKPKEHDDLQWYLEEYWKWPYEEFARRGQQIEQGVRPPGVFAHLEVDKGYRDRVSGHLPRLLIWNGTPDVIPGSEAFFALIRLE